MPILGLAHTETSSDWRFRNIRRRVFYQYPNGKLPLVGILSLLGEDVTNDPEFRWFEKRYVGRRHNQHRDTANNRGPWRNSADNGEATTLSVGTEYVVYIATTTGTTAGILFKIGDVLLCDVTADGGIRRILVRVLSRFDTTATFFKLRVVYLGRQDSLGAITITQDNTTNSGGRPAVAVGTAYGEGAPVSAETVYHQPAEFSNFTQIFRTPFAISGTAMATSLRYDETGLYKDLAKEAALQHMADIERAFLFGSSSGPHITMEGLTLRVTNGICRFLIEWEKGGSYRTGANVVTSGWSADEKRIIDLTGTALTERIYDTLLERVFRVTNNTTNEKLAVCGNQALNTLNQLYKSKSVLTADLPMEDTYGMNVVKHVTPFGTLYYKTHPLFNEDPNLRGSMMIIDVNNLRYRYLNGRDTTLLKNRQHPGEDLRRDEWLTECGLEVRYPESHMYITGINDYTV